VIVSDNSVRFIGVTLVLVLAGFGCSPASKHTTPPAHGNAARTCKTSFDGEMPTDICATWGVPVNDANMIVTAEMPPILISAPRINYLLGKNLCSTVSYVNRTGRVVRFDWNLDFEPGPSDVVTYPGEGIRISSLSAASTASSTLADSLLTAGGHASGTVCGSIDGIDNVGLHGTLILTCTAATERPTSPSWHPTRYDSEHGLAAAVRIVWRATL